MVTSRVASVTGPFTNSLSRWLVMDSKSIAADSSSSFSFFGGMLKLYRKQNNSVQKCLANFR